MSLFSASEPRVSTLKVEFNSVSEYTLCSSTEWVGDFWTNYFSINSNSFGFYSSSCYCKNITVLAIFISVTGFRFGISIISSGSGSGGGGYTIGSGDLKKLSFWGCGFGD